jgi:iron-sulfur cluster repair protein YtfE (RIC family)
MLADWHQRHHQEVGEAERMIGEIGRLQPREDRWLQMVTQLRSTLEQHIQTEEGQIWPRIQQMWGADKLEHAGEQIQNTVRSTGSGRERAA